MKKLSVKPFRAVYCAPDLINLDGKVPSLRKRLYLSIKETHKALNIASKRIDNFYHLVSLIHTKRHFRVALKFIVFLSLYSLTITTYSSYHDNFILIGSAVFIMISLIVYLQSFSSSTIAFYKQFSQIIMVAFLVLFMYCYKINNPSEYQYTPTSQIFLIMYAVLPIKLEVTMAIGCLYTSAHLSFLYTRIVEFRRNGYRLFHNQINSKDLFKNKENTSYVTAQFCLWLALHMLGIYIHFCNQFRRRASFLRLGENVKSQLKNNEAYDYQMKCIEAIMPEAITGKYWEEQKVNDGGFWLFCRTYNKVSIVFADIVGFTKMSSNKSADRIVSLLNDLFNRFDDECSQNNCVKIGTIGDCYYCVAGCPVPRSDHAVCCIEFGLGMCRITKEFNQEYNENMNMRIGIHSGQVNAAIIGKLRFRFDVYSMDVFIANEAEAMGVPGKVQITESTFELVKWMYTVETGRGLQIKREVDQGLAGKKLVNKQIKTYFIVKSSAPNQQRCYRVNSDFSCQDCKSSSNEKNNTVNDESLDDNQTFIKILTDDPRGTIKLFGRLPISNFTMKFIDEDLEHQYTHHTKTELKAITIDSVAIAPLLDSIISLVYALFIFISGMILLTNEYQIMKTHFSVLKQVSIYFVGIAIAIINGWKSFNSYPTLSGNRLKLFKFVSSELCQNILQMYMASLSFIISIFFYDGSKFYQDYIYTTGFFSLIFFSILNFTLFTPPCTLMKMITLSIIFILSVLNIVLCDRQSKCAITLFESIYNYCSQETTENVWIHELALQMSLQLLITASLVLFLDRENQKNLRLCFYIRREVERKSDDATKSVTEAQNLLHNIIPKYVLDTINRRGGDIIRGNCCYAKSVENAGIGFACISNFFACYYREDYQSGRGALRLLNKIICSFDEVINNQRFNDLEKIKTINDCYMFAAGLNVKKVHENNDKKKHLRAFMNFSFELLEKMKQFNDSYIYGSEKFELKIGVSVGTVTAGVIGVTKPLFDVWGDTVNVASRMCSTAEPGEIQATEGIYRVLAKEFTFIHKGIWNIKGKGRMETYTCEGLSDLSIDISDLFINLV